MMNFKLSSLLLNASAELGCSPPVCVSSVRHFRSLRPHAEHALPRYKQTIYRPLPHPKEKAPMLPKVKLPHNFRFVYPEFLPDPTIIYRNKLREKMERIDMMARRAHINIPEFYVGSVMAVTVNDPNATGNTTRFVGLCVQRGGSGLAAWFQLRNVIDNQGLEIRYNMYCPLVSSVETLRLEKRLDEHLLYLRDADLQYSYFPQDMESEMIPEGVPVPVNETKVKLKKDIVWRSEWERKELKGVEFDDLTEEQLHQIEKSKTPYYVKFDLMKHYRATIPEEDQEEIYRDLAPQYPALQATQRRTRRRKLAGEL